MAMPLTNLEQRRNAQAEGANRRLLAIYREDMQKLGIPLPGAGD